MSNQGQINQATQATYAQFLRLFAITELKDMMKFLCTLACGLLCISSFGQNQRVSAVDVTNFWMAHDSIATTTDSLKQLDYIQRLYIDKGSNGLKALIAVKEYTAPEWVHALRRYPKFWRSIRANTLAIQTKINGVEPYLAKFKQLYPALKPAGIYVTIGALRTSGTTKDSLVLIGAELVATDSTTDLSEFPEKMQSFLRRYSKTQPAKSLVLLNVHEYVHTQENRYGTNVLGQAVYEGTCDFVAQLLTNQVPALPYMQYGPAHERAIKQRFQDELFNPDFDRWFYNQTGDADQVPDLGYYMGYMICKAYYGRATDKKQAIRDMIELDYTSDQAVEQFVTTSGYFPVSLTKLRAAYEAKRPTIVRVWPALTQPVDTTVTEIRIVFSQPMDRYTATDYGSGGKAEWPITGRVGFSADRLSYTYKVTLRPDHQYSFWVNGGGFRSIDGRPLKSYEVRFKTR